MSWRPHLVEAIVGLLVVVVTLGLVIAFWQRTGGGGGAGGESVSVMAVFPNANGVDVGTEVRVAGLLVGRVTEVSLDPEAGYQAEVGMAIDSGANLPNDSSAAITTEGLLGGSYIALIPGGSAEPFADNDVIMDTQGAIDMMALVGSLINDSGGDESGGGADDFDTMSDDFVAPRADDVQ